MRVWQPGSHLAAERGAQVSDWSWRRTARRLSTLARLARPYRRRTALAVGALLATGEQLIDALFGAPGTLSPWELGAGLVGATVVIAFMILARDRLVLLFLSSDVARTAGIDVQRLSLLYLLACALTVALGLRYLRALLMGSLIIIPAATARQLARNMSQMLGWSVGLAVFATIVGAWIAEATGHETGPLIVIVAAGCFVIVTALRRR